MDTLINDFIYYRLDLNYFVDKKKENKKVVQYNPVCRKYFKMHFARKYNNN